MKILDQIKQLNKEMIDNQNKINEEIEIVEAKISEAMEQEKILNESIIKKFDLKLKAKKMQLSKEIKELQEEKDQLKIMVNDTVRTIEVDEMQVRKEVTEHINTKYDFSGKVNKVKEARDTYSNAVNELNSLVLDVDAEISDIKSQLTNNTNIDAYGLKVYTQTRDLTDLRYYSKRELDDTLRLIDRVRVISHSW